MALRPPRGRSPEMADLVRLTVAQALGKFLGAQYSESDGEEQKLFAGCFGIFGHASVAGIGQALLQAELEEPDLEGDLGSPTSGVEGDLGSPTSGVGGELGSPTNRSILPYILGRNEQAMVHTAVAYARMKNRLQVYAVSTSVGPGATNMVTGAAL